MSDENSDSETSEISSELAMSSNKVSTFPAEHNYNNEETPFKKTMLEHGHKKDVLETIKKLHFKCGGNELYENLYILPSQWINLLKFEKIG